MEFLYLLEQLRTPWLDKLMYLITQLGDEIGFLALALVLFWCVNKRQGYYLMSVGFFGTLASQALKLACRIPRPWVLDPNFTIVESARAGAGGYSFPSGHSQNAVATFGSLAICTRMKWLRWCCVVLCVIVPFSRMYLGVHTPKDVLVGVGLALVLLAVLKPIVFGNDGKNIPKLFGVMIGLSIAFVLYTQLFPFPANIDEGNLNAAIQNSYTLLGALSAMVVVYYVDEKKLHFSTDAIWYAQILKVVLGIILVLLIKEGLKLPLNAIFHGHMAARAVRYAIVVLFAGLVWPMTFPWFAKLGRKEA